ncbi:MAG: hypothetical protein ACYTBR_15290, partial [Planctomycetota bacterium]
MTLGTSYLIRVSGFNVSCGTYALTVSCSGDGGCDVVCSPGATDENEPNCGLPSDTVNGGCNSAMPVFSTIACGETVCGTGAFDGATRDTDWYQITVAVPTVFTWTVTAEFDALTGPVPTDPPGTGDCADVLGVVDPAAFPLACETATVVTECQPPGTYWFFVAPVFGDLVPCGAEYEATLICTPCSIPTGACCFADGSCIDNLFEGECGQQGGSYQGDGTDCAGVTCVALPDDCADAAPVACGGSVTVDNTTATDDPTDPPFSCRFGGAGNGFGSLWFTFVATETSAFLDTNSSPTGDDSILAVYDGTCGSLVEIGCSEDEGVGLLSQLCVEGLTVGNTYYIQLAAWSDSDRGEYTLNIQCPCSGACCFPDGSCQAVSGEGECASLGGEYQGDGSNCGDVFCPVVPPNDLCENAIGPLSVPSSTPGSTDGATTDSGFPFCGTGITSPGVWYTVIGTGTTMTASLCTGATNYDSKLSVYCNGCLDPTCVVGIDDFCGLQSEVSWCAQAGAEYLILVHGFGGQSGPFELELSDDGVSCVPDVECPVLCGSDDDCPPGFACIDGECVLIPTGACCQCDGQDQFCTIESEDDCAALGGNYLGDDTSCTSAAGYAWGFCNSPFEDISGTGIPLDLPDDGGEVVPIGFTFNLVGDDHTCIGVASNGYLTFGTDLSDLSDDSIPNTNDP